MGDHTPAPDTRIIISKGKDAERVPGSIFSPLLPFSLLAIFTPASCGYTLGYKMLSCSGRWLAFKASLMISSGAVSLNQIS